MTLRDDGPGRAGRQRHRAGRAVGRLAMLAALQLHSGCLIVPATTRATIGALLPEEQLTRLRAGATRREILDGFGPPLAVVRRGSGPVQVPVLAFRAEGAEALLVERSFERFVDQPAGPDDVIYFYRAHQVVTSGSGVALIIGDKGGLIGDSRIEHRDERLWVLLDGSTGRVRAHRLEREQPPPPEPTPGRDGDATWGEGTRP